MLLLVIYESNWRRLVSNPVGHHENIKLKLLGDWEPLDNSRPEPFGLREVTLSCFLNGNKIVLQYSRKSKNQIRFLWLFHNEANWEKWWFGNVVERGVVS